MNGLFVLNIKVIKTEVGQKLHHGLLHQVVFTYCWYNYFLVVMLSGVIRYYPYPQSSEIMELLRNVISACNSWVNGDDTFYFYNLSIIFQFSDVITIKPLI